MLDCETVLAHCLFIIFYKHYVSFSRVWAQEIEVHVHVEGILSCSRGPGTSLEELLTGLQIVHSKNIFLK